MSGQPPCIELQQIRDHLDDVAMTDPAPGETSRIGMDLFMIPGYALPRM